jgi:glycosyltransferase involved in cell wall biosynthesis
MDEKTSGASDAEIETKIAGFAGLNYSIFCFQPQKYFAQEKTPILKLIVVHYHFRPGGIRRIIELGAPCLVKGASEPVSEVILAGGELPDSDWQQTFQQALRPVPARYFVQPEFGYLSEQSAPGLEIEHRIREAFERLLEQDCHRDCLVWAHNLGIARNLLLSRELEEVCRRKKIPLVSHHHDWWFDNRWLRWPEMRHFGIRTLKAAAEAVFPKNPLVVHAGINHADVTAMQRGLPERAFWLPNLTERMLPPAPSQIRKAKRWLSEKLGEKNGPVWVVPCRLLRRKNLAEALLLARWLRPEAWLVSTGKISSLDEKSYAEKLIRAGRKRRWKMALCILEGEERAPSIPELLAASEAVLLTSVQEGFGLPFVEAAACERPLIARAIPNIAPDLDQFGFKFHQYYQEILIDPSLFDLAAEKGRQARLFAQWRSSLPARARPWVERPALFQEIQNGRPVPFSRLTLTAQIEVLDQPLEFSWELGAASNPFLRDWKELAKAGALKPVRWPATANHWLKGEAYARRFWANAGRTAFPLPRGFEPEILQEDFMRQMLGAQRLFPLLWARET